ncbi:MAG: hypothetical protein WB495_14935 [Xanthobacteraceae bacterium]|jgi:hypothetical protein
MNATHAERPDENVLRLLWSQRAVIQPFKTWLSIRGVKTFDH